MAEDIGPYLQGPPVLAADIIERQTPLQTLQESRVGKSLGLEVHHPFQICQVHVAKIRPLLTQIFHQFAMEKAQNE
mgnify:CR=1 FL=1